MTTSVSANTTEEQLAHRGLLCSHFTQTRTERLFNLSKTGNGTRATSHPQNKDLSEVLLIHLQIKSCLDQTGWRIRISDREH